MNSRPRTSRSVYWTLIGGILIGAISMAGIHQGSGASQALAQSTADVSGGFAPRTISGTTTESIAELRNLDSSFANLAEFAQPAVVHIRSESGSRAATADGMRMPRMGGEGSGFIFRPDGYIITNDHVVDGFERVTVILKDGREFPGQVTRANDADIAIIKIDASNLPTLQFADSSKVRPGQFAIAVGAPFGLENTVTVGHVSAIGRINSIEERMYPDLIQTDAAINVGNSGGPLLNIDGQVIGVNTAIFSPNGTSAGVGFAIPANQVRLIADILIREGKLTRSMLKLSPEDLKEFEKKELGIAGGARVVSVMSDGPAAAAGIKVGDIITRVGNTVVNSQLDLRNSLLIYRPNTEVEIELLRSKERIRVKAKLVPYEIPREQRTQGLRRMPRTQEEMREWFRQFPELRELPFDQDSIRPKTEDAPTPAPRAGGPARLGVSVEDVTAAMRNQFNIPADTSGAVVTMVERGSTASEIGMKPGDVVTRLGERDVTRASDLVAAIRGLQRGDQRSIEFWRYENNSQTKMRLDVRF